MAPPSFVLLIYFVRGDWSSSGSAEEYRVKYRPAVWKFVVGANPSPMLIPVQTNIRSVQPSPSSSSTRRLSENFLPKHRQYEPTLSFFARQIVSGMSKTVTAQLELLNGRRGSSAMTDTRTTGATVVLLSKFSGQSPNLSTTVRPLYYPLESRIP